tara:strand:- start:1792 stop:2151 length:360 start_codon:yes stop_codon:yes gene_type:complete
MGVSQLLHWHRVRSPTGMLNGSLVVPTLVVQVVVATGLYQQVCRRLRGIFGDLVVMDTAIADATGVKTGMVLVVDGIIQKLLLQLAVVHILYVLLGFIDAVQENVQDVMDVHHTLMDIT